MEDLIFGVAEFLVGFAGGCIFMLIHRKFVAERIYGRPNR
jgi:hypothetical protein